MATRSKGSFLAGEPNLACAGGAELSAAVGGGQATSEAPLPCSALTS